MDGESSRIHGAVAFDDLTLIIDTDEVGDRDMAEVDGEGVDPEKFGVLRVAGSDVAGHSLIETELGEEAEAGGQTLFTVATLLFHGGEDGGRGNRLGPVIHFG